MPNPLSFPVITDFSLTRKKNVLAAGRLDVWDVKGFDILIKAWGLIAKKYPDWKLEIAGLGDEEYKIRMRERYEDCWEHHYKSNDHHPEYWYDFQTQTASDMSLVAILHMICDWEGMSIKFKQNTLDWYENDKGGKAEKDKMMTSHTKEILNDFLYNILFV